jgi:hypothetical protein
VVDDGACVRVCVLCTRRFDNNVWVYGCMVYGIYYLFENTPLANVSCLKSLYCRFLIFFSKFTILERERERERAKRQK